MTNPSNNVRMPADNVFVSLPVVLAAIFSRDSFSGAWGGRERERRWPICERGGKPRRKKGKAGREHALIRDLQRCITKRASFACMPAAPLATSPAAFLFSSFRRLFGCLRSVFLLFSLWLEPSPTTALKPSSETKQNYKKSCRSGIIIRQRSATATHRFFCLGKASRAVQVKTTHKT